MKVVVITERGEDFAAAVVKLPDDKTADDVFLAWLKAGCKGGHCSYDTDDKSDDEIWEMNTEYAHTELTVLE